MRAAPIPIRRIASISRVRFYVATPGTGLTVGRNFVGVYASSGQLIGSSIDQSGAWSRTGASDATLVGRPFTIDAGFVWVAIIAHGATLPALGKSFSLTPTMANGYLPTALSRYGSIGSDQLNLPDTISPSSITPTATQWWAAIA